jgi:flagellar basal-body rod modification protein FlgD
MSTISSGISTQPAPTTRVQNPKSALKVEDFINMMVTQLQYQDPLEPAKNDQLLAQMSQIGQLQSAQTTQDTMKDLVLQNNIGAASNLIGKSIEGVDTEGEKVDGVVQSVRVEKGSVFLELSSGKKLALANVTEVADDGAGRAVNTPTNGASTATGTGSTGATNAATVTTAPVPQSRLRLVPVDAATLEQFIGPIINRTSASGTAVANPG